LQTSLLSLAHHASTHCSLHQLGKQWPTEPVEESWRQAFPKKSWQDPSLKVSLLGPEKIPDLFSQNTQVSSSMEQQRFMALLGLGSEGMGLRRRQQKG